MRGLASHLREAGHSAEAVLVLAGKREVRSEEHTSELQSPEAISYAVFCLKNKQVCFVLLPPFAIFVTTKIGCCLLYTSIALPFSHYTMYTESYSSFKKDLSHKKR